MLFRLSIHLVVLKIKIKTVLNNLKSFLKPFPGVGTWSYRLQTWLYDKRLKIIPLEVENGTENGILDTPAYLRRSNDPSRTYISKTTVASDGGSNEREYPVDENDDRVDRP